MITLAMSQNRCKFRIVESEVYVSIDPRDHVSISIFDYSGCYCTCRFKRLSRSVTRKSLKCATTFGLGRDEVSQDLQVYAMRQELCETSSRIIAMKKIISSPALK